MANLSNPVQLEDRPFHGMRHHDDENLTESRVVFLSVLYAK